MQGQPGRDTEGLPMSIIGTLDMLWEDNERLRARVESQRQVIDDLRMELENACRRIVELERGGDGA